MNAVDAERQMKHCAKCGQDKHKSFFHKHSRYKDGLEYTCKSCVLSRAQDYRRRCRTSIKERDAKYKSANPTQYRARTAVNNALQIGALIKAPCVICGSSMVHGHHDNYARPLDVVWLCASHHKERHHALIAALKESNDDA